MPEQAILNIVLYLPLAGIALLAATPAKQEGMVRQVSLWVMVVQFVLTAWLYQRFDATVAGLQFETMAAWIPAWGVYYQIGLDGYNILLVALTAFLGPLVVAGAFTAIKKDVKLFYSMVFLIQFAMLGAFVAQDLFLFYLFWETMLIPMFLLIGIWGGERRIYATLKFFLYTAFGSILMLAALIYLVLSLQATTGITSFAFADLYGARLPLSTQLVLLSAFGLSFAIKVPMVPLHTWLPDAHVEAPTAGSVILAGVLLKMGTYGFMKLGFPLFPDATREITPLIQALAVVSIVYGACLALVQDDIKKIIAYSSISHLGYVMLGLASLDILGIQGAVIQMVSHGLIAARAVPHGRHDLRALPHARARRVRRNRETAAGVLGVLHDPHARLDRAADHQRLHRGIPRAARRLQVGVDAIPAGFVVPDVDGGDRRVRRGAGRAVHAALRPAVPVRPGQGAAHAARRPRHARAPDPRRDRGGGVRPRHLPRRPDAEDRACRPAVP